MLHLHFYADEGYGFIKTREGRELYFHRNSVLNDDFDRLALGTGVRFASAGGKDGPGPVRFRSQTSRGIEALAN